ncbi:pyridoxamine 5'-phosphate oxidase family protein [Halobacteria archaeon AArc-curdl1]|uniref:Pyridoxamine 5'-phosphate oxidase family protein n=1 Tax=Natronosalvus hydrolyticus TaxID=2979988 RepID=A0AAP2Z5M5_9EURY|nr:pyridoxamine 5'-phosphate oxidase family protein [Halobacteria archaeon AArc-curdl1]
MRSLRWVQLPRDEIDSVLGTGGVGVLSFATDAGKPPFSIPVSYGFYPEDDSFYFHLAFPRDDSTKAELLTNPVTFVVHTHPEEGWRSVVASGTLEEIDESPYESMAVQGMWGVEIPEVEVFERPRDEITFRDFRLVPDTLTGRKEIESED